jgi:RsiW-degrading membrane proteinase PrsW (M82 family)
VDDHAVLLSSLLGVLFVLILLYLDKYEREPLLKIGTLFAASILATGLYGGIHSRIAGEEDPWTLGLVCIRTPLLEEGLKFGLFLLVYLSWRRWIDEPYDLAVYLGIIALGFSVQENIGYYVICTRHAFLSGVLTGDFSWYDRALAGIAARRAVPGHLMMGVVGAWVMACGFGKRSFPLWFVAAYLAAVVVHAGWNFFAFGGMPALFFYLMPLVVCTCLIVRRLREGSIYWRTQRRWRDATYRILHALERSAAVGEMIPPEAQALVESGGRGLRQIQRVLRGLPLRPGTDQARIFRALEEELPDGRSAFDIPALEDLDRRLVRIGEVLGPYRSSFLHWTYWFALLAILTSLGFLATILSLVLERAIVRL